MKKLLPTVLIIIGLALGYFGFNKLQGSSAGVEIGNLEIKAEDQNQKGTAYIMLGLGVVCLVGGFVQMAKK